MACLQPFKNKMAIEVTPTHPNTTGKKSEHGASLASDKIVLTALYQV